MVQKTNKPKSSAYYQREYRKRLREQGLVKKEVWILPQHNPALAAVEKVLRQQDADTAGRLADLPISAAKQKQLNSQTPIGSHLKEGEWRMQNAEESMVDNINDNIESTAHKGFAAGGLRWTTQSLYQSLKKAPLFLDNAATIELIEGVDATIHIIMHEFGDLPIFLTVFGEQILAESLLFPANEVTNQATFNELMLRTHKCFPLSTICLEKYGADEYYQMFGALSSTSGLQDVLVEIKLLANNVILATESFSEFFITEKIAS